MIKYDTDEAAAIKQRWKDGTPGLSDNYDFYVLAVRRARLAVIDYINQQKTYTPYACTPAENLRLIWCDRDYDSEGLEYKVRYWIPGLRGVFAVTAKAGNNNTAVDFIDKWSSEVLKDFYKD